MANKEIKNTIGVLAEIGGWLIAAKGVMLGFLNLAIGGLVLIVGGKSLQTTPSTS